MIDDKTPTEFEIASDIPIPSTARTGFSKTARALKISQSFWSSKKVSACGVALNQIKASTGYDFTCRTMDGGTRIWRIK